VASLTARQPKLDEKTMTQMVWKIRAVRFFSGFLAQEDLKKCSWAWGLLSTAETWVT